MPVAAYDAHADWYEDYLHSAASGYTRRIQDLLCDLLGPGVGQTCLDVCCGTGAHADTLYGLGWTPVGVDLSRGQLRHGARRLPVAGRRRGAAGGRPVGHRLRLCAGAHRPA